MGSQGSLDSRVCSVRSFCRVRIVCRVRRVRGFVGPRVRGFAGLAGCTGSWVRRTRRVRGFPGFAGFEGSWVRTFVGLGGCRVRGFVGSLVCGFVGSQGLRGSWGWGPAGFGRFAVFARFAGSRVREFAGLWVRRFAGSQVRGLAGSWVLEFAGFARFIGLWVCGFPGSRVHRVCREHGLGGSQGSQGSQVFACSQGRLY